MWCSIWCIHFEENWIQFACNLNALAWNNTPSQVVICWAQIGPTPPFFLEKGLSCSDLRSWFLIFTWGVIFRCFFKPGLKTSPTRSRWRHGVSTYNVCFLHHTVSSHMVWATGAGRITGWLLHPFHAQGTWMLMRLKFEVGNLNVASLNVDAF